MPWIDPISVLASTVAHSSHDVSKALFRSFIEAPRLIDDLPEAQAFDSHSLIEPADLSPLNLEQKLGHLYEDAFAVMLGSTPRYDLLGRSIQIQQEASQTLGELDFMLQDRDTDQLIHLELAVKFYLAVETESGLLLPGPDARDNYYQKLEKLRSQQLVLTKKHRDLLPTAFQSEEIIVQQLVHGCIFHHVNAKHTAEAELLNPHGRRGKWLHARDRADYFGKDALLEIIPKPLWPVPLGLLDTLTLDPLDLTAEIDRCVMARRGRDRTPYFIAPDGYPAKGSACGPT